MNQSSHISSQPAPTSDDDDVIDLGALLGVLWRKKWWIAVCAIIFTLMGGFYAYEVATPKYRSTSVILLDPAGQQVVDLSAVLPSLGTDSEAINTEVEVIKSRRLLERVSLAADLINDPEFNSALRPVGLVDTLKAKITGEEHTQPTQQAQHTLTINALLERLSVRNISNTYVLQITLVTEGAEKSAALADTVAEQYILYQMDVKFDATRDASEWLTSRVADLKLELEDAEAKVAAFATNSTVVSAESVQALDRQLKDLRERETTARLAADAAAQYLATLQALETAIPEQKVEQLKDAQLTSALRTFGEGSAFDARFAQLLARARTQAQRTDAQYTSLTGSIQAREIDIATQNEEIIQLQQLSREAEASRLLYEYFLGRLKETSAQEGIQTADSRILSNAVIPRDPSEPRKPLIVAMSLILGLITGSTLALLWESKQNGYRNSTELELATGLPVMGQIPLFPSTVQDLHTYTIIRQRADQSRCSQMCLKATGQSS